MSSVSFAISFLLDFLTGTISSNFFSVIDFFSTASINSSTDKELASLSKPYLVVSSPAKYGMFNQLPVCLSFGSWSDH